MQVDDKTTLITILKNQLFYKKPMQ